jgi:uncharacterized phage-like protein YoqJ
MLRDGERVGRVESCECVHTVNSDWNLLKLKIVFMFELRAHLWKYNNMQRYHRVLIRAAAAAAVRVNMHECVVNRLKCFGSRRSVNENRK